MDKQKRCVNCILPESFPGITFDEQGVCNFCSSHQTIAPLGEEKLLDILSNRKGTIYDCVVPLSGGKDSTYVLYYAVKELGLRAIGVNYDSGFQSEMSVRNIKRACEILDVPLVIHRADFHRRVEILKEIFNIANIVGLPIGVCANCHNGIRAASRYAAKLHGVRTVLSGTTQFERFGHNPITGRKYLLRKLTKCNLPRLLPHLIRCAGLIARERVRLDKPTWGKPYLYGDKGDVETVYLFDYIPWACMHTEIVGLLGKELEWKYPGDRVDRFDCFLHPFLNYKWFVESGISLDGYLYSNMIRMGAISREDALTREEGIERELRQDCSELIKLREFNGVTLDWLRP